MIVWLSSWMHGWLAGLVDDGLEWLLTQSDACSLARPCCFICLPACSTR